MGLAVRIAATGGVAHQVARQSAHLGRAAVPRRGFAADYALGNQPGGVRTNRRAGELFGETDAGRAVADAAAEATARSANFGFGRRRGIVRENTIADTRRHHEGFGYCQSDRMAAQTDRGYRNTAATAEEETARTPRVC